MSAGRPAELSAARAAGSERGGGRGSGEREARLAGGGGEMSSSVGFPPWKRCYLFAGSGRLKVGATRRPAELATRGPSGGQREERGGERRAAGGGRLVGAKWKGRAGGNR